MAKGNKVAIEGKLRWSLGSATGSKRSKLEVIVDELEFMSSRDGGGTGWLPVRAMGSAGHQPAPQASTSPAGTDG